MKLLLLLLFPVAMQAQTGKLWSNQSLRMEMKWYNNAWSVFVTNMNACKSVIEINWDGILMKSDSVAQYQAVFPIVIFPPQVIKARNITYCYGGTNDWLTMDAKIRAEEIKKGTVTFIQPGKSLSCDKEIINPPVITDSTVATRMRQSNL
jgi:hypothetical protein